MAVSDLVRRVLSPPSISRGVDAAITPAIFGRGLDLVSARSRSGEVVTELSALQTSTVWSCVWRISSTISALPMHAFRRIGASEVGREKLTPQPRWLQEPGRLDRTELVGQALTSLLLWGNAYILVLRDDTGRVLGLDVLDPKRVTVEGADRFVWRGEDGREVRLGSSDVAHVRGLMLPGSRVGLSPIAHARESIGLSMAASRFGSEFFSVGAVPDVILSVPGQASQTAIDQLKENWANGPGSRSPGRSRIGVLTEGVEAESLTMPLEDAQFLETRRFQLAEIANIYLMPLHLLNAEGPQFGDTVAEQGVAFVQQCLTPWIARLERALTAVLHSDGAARWTFVRINPDALMRGDPVSRAQFYATMTNTGAIVPNDIREWEDMPPVPWGDRPVSVQVQEGVGSSTPDDSEDGSEDA